MNARAVLLAAVVALCAAPAAAAFNANEWRFRREVRLPPPNPKGYYYLRLDQEVFRYSNPNLSDLRLVNGRGLEVPYVLEVRNEEPRWDRYQPRVWREGSDIMLDLGRPGLSHNQVLLVTQSTNFRGRAAVYGRDFADDWRLLARDLAVFDHTAQVHAGNLRLEYPETKCQYLKIVLSLDRGEIAEPGAEVMMVRTIAAEYQDLAEIEHRCEQDPVNNDTVCRLGTRKLPVSRINISAADDGFFRAARLLDRQGRELASTCLYRYQDRDLVRQGLWLTFPETQAEELVLRIQNFDDQPLAIDAVQASTTARDLVFRAGPNDGFRIYLGNPKARTPVYDLSMLMDRVKPEPRPVWAEMGPAGKNPDFAAPPPPTAPEIPGLDYSDLMWPGLLIAGLVLGWLIITSVRQMSGGENSHPPDDEVN